MPTAKDQSRQAIRAIVHVAHRCDRIVSISILLLPARDEFQLHGFQRSNTRWLMASDCSVNKLQYGQVFAVTIWRENRRFLPKEPRRIRNSQMIAHSTRTMISSPTAGFVDASVSPVSSIGICCDWKIAEFLEFVQRMWRSRFGIPTGRISLRRRIRKRPICRGSVSPQHR